MGLGQKPLPGRNCVPSVTKNLMLKPQARRDTSAGRDRAPLFLEAEALSSSQSSVGPELPPPDARGQAATSLPLARQDGVWPHLARRQRLRRAGASPSRTLHSPGGVTQGGCRFFSFPLKHAYSVSILGPPSGPLPCPLPSSIPPLSQMGKKSASARGVGWGWHVGIKVWSGKVRQVWPWPKAGVRPHRRRWPGLLSFNR